MPTLEMEDLHAPNHLKHAILIHAHRLPAQFGRLCNALSHPDFDIYANIDLKADIRDFQATSSQVHFIEKRIDVKWGHWSQVEATLNSLKEIVSSGRKYGHVIFISGQDYPCVSMTEIAAFLNTNRNIEFITGRALDQFGHEEQQTIEARYTHRHAFFKSKWLTKKANRILRLLPPKKHILPFYKGSSWWNLSFDCVQAILDYVIWNPKTVGAYRMSHCPDEMFFHSLLNSWQFGDRIVNRNFRYIDWTEGKANPKTLTSEDFEKIVENDAWFARKLDIEKSGQLFDLLDQYKQDKSKLPTHLPHLNTEKKS